jgi:hypothetical protein
VIRVFFLFFVFCFLFFVFPKRPNVKEKKHTKKRPNAIMEGAAVDIDDARVVGQNYALISFVSPSGAQRSGTLGFRLYGAFDTIEVAREHAARVNATDSAFDVYVVEMRKWCAWNPDPMDVEEKVYTDRRLDEMIRAHREAQDTAQSAYEERLAQSQRTDEAEVAVKPTGEKSDAHDEKEEAPTATTPTPSGEHADGDEVDGDEGVQDYAKDGVRVPDHVPE